MCATTLRVVNIFLQETAAFVLRDSGPFENEWEMPGSAFPSMFCRQARRCRCEDGGEMEGGKRSRCGAGKILVSQRRILMRNNLTYCMEWSNGKRQHLQNVL